MISTILLASACLPYASGGMPSAGAYASSASATDNHHVTVKVLTLHGGVPRDSVLGLVLELDVDEIPTPGVTLFSPVSLLGGTTLLLPLLAADVSA